MITKLVTVVALLLALPVTAFAQTPEPATETPGAREILSAYPQRDQQSDTHGVSPVAKISATWLPVGVTVAKFTQTPNGAQKPVTIPTTPTAGGGMPQSKSLRFPRPDQTVYFNGSRTTDNDGTVAKYEWIFSRENAKTITSDQPQVALTPQDFFGDGRITAAPINATLKVTDSDGLTSTARVVVTFGFNLPPKVDLQRFRRVIQASTVKTPTGLTPKISEPLYPTNKNVDFSKIAAALPLTTGVPSRLYANADDPDGEIVSYRFDLQQNNDLLIDRGRTDEVTVTPTQEGEHTYRVVVTDDEGATAESILKVPARIPCAGKNTEIQVNRHLSLFPGTACVVKDDTPKNSYIEYRVAKPGEIWLNGLVITMPVGATVRGDRKRDDGCVNSEGSMVTATSAAGVRLNFPAQKLAFCVGHDLGDVVGLDFKGATMGSLEVINWGPKGPLMKNRQPFSADVITKAPAVFGGNTLQKPASFVAQPPQTAAAQAASPHAQASQAGFEIGPVDMEIGGVQGSFHLKYDGADNWDISGKAKLAAPLSLAGDISIWAEIRNGEFEYLKAEQKFADPGVLLGTTGISITAIDFSLSFGSAHESDCVPDVGKKYTSLQSFRDMLVAYGWTKAASEKAIPDIRADHGIPSFALCGGLSFKFGGNPIGAGSLVRGKLSLGIASYDDRPGVFRVVGDPLKVVELVNASVKFEAYTNGYINFEAAAGFNLLDLIKFDAKVYFEANGSKFNAGAVAEITIIPLGASASGEILIGSKGAGGCLRVTDPFGGVWRPGATMVWGQGPDFYLDGCDVDEVKAVVPGSGGGTKYELVYVGAGASQNAKTAQAPKTVAPNEAIELDVRSGLPGVVFAVAADVRGQRLPKFTLTTPSGAVLPVDDVVPTNDRLLEADGKPKILRSKRFGLTQVVIPNAPGGKWKLTNTGQVTIASVRVMEGAPHPKVVFSPVKSLRGGQKGLAVQIKDKRKGIVATMVESGATGGSVIGRVRLAPDSRGISKIAKAFTPRATRAEPRELRVFLERNGVPVAMFQKPSAFQSNRPSPPPKVSGLKVSRGLSGLAAKWIHKPGIKGYQVRIEISDGRTVVRTVKSNGIKVTMPLPKYLQVKVSVKAVSALDAVSSSVLELIKGKGSAPSRSPSAASKKAHARMR